MLNVSRLQFTIAAAAALLAFPAAATSSRRPTAAPPPQVVSRPATVDNNASCDISVSPSATLLLPYFQVDIAKPVNDAANTIFTIVNTARQPQIARVTVWTDQGFPAIWFNVFLTGYDAQAISMYDVVARGVIPQTSTGTAFGNRSAANDSNPSFISTAGCAQSGGAISAGTLATLQSMLTTGVRDSSETTCKVGGTHANATGYATVDVVSSCSMLSPLDMSYYSQVLAFDNVLTGDYQHVFPDRATGNYAGGSPMVHIKAIPGGGPASASATALPYTFYDRYTPPGARRIDRRQPLPSAFAARFIQGGTNQFNTELVVWREGTPPSNTNCVTANAALPVASLVRFDEDENPTTTAVSASFGIPVSAALSTSSTMFPPIHGYSVSGWMFLNLDNRLGNANAISSPYSSARPSQNWLIVHMRAEGRYGVDYDATALGNGCQSAITSSIVPAPPSAGVTQ